MWNIAPLLLATIFLSLWLQKLLSKSFIRARTDYEETKSKHDALLAEHAKLGQENINLERTAEEIIALYNITKNICASLDENKVFDNFRNQINKYVEVSDCKFARYDEDLSQYKDYTVLPLSINSNPVGYLITSHIKEEEKDKFYILSQQFLLGIKRALLYKKIQELAITDSLTKVFSRRYLLERLDEEIERSRKFKYNFSFLMLDIDHFKDYNDRYGHLVGDAILKDVANVIKEGIRQIDLVGRYGGEEFSIILTETGKEQAGFIAERLRQDIEERNIRVYDENLKVTVSIGISIFPENSPNAIELIDAADKALYQAKETGRNRICIYTVNK